MNEVSDQDEDTGLFAPKKEIHPPTHYHGDKVRQLFFITGVIMILGLPLFSAQVNVGGFVAVLGILIIDFFAGMTSPSRKVAIVFDLLISLIGTGFFELTAFYRFNMVSNFFDGYFWFNEIIALLFFAALYFSTKTFRKMAIEAENK